MQPLSCEDHFKYNFCCANWCLRFTEALQTLGDVLQGPKCIPVPAFTKDIRIMEHLCFNSANVTVLSLESLLSIYRLLCSSKISGQLEELSQNTVLASGLCVSHYTLLQIAGYSTALPLEGAESTPWYVVVKCLSFPCSSSLRPLMGLLTISKYRLLLLGILP